MKSFKELIGYKTRQERHVTNVVDKKKGIGFSIMTRPPARSIIDLDDWLTGFKMAESVIRPRRNKIYNLYFQAVIDDDYITGWNKRQSAITNLNLQYLVNEKVDDKVLEFMKNPNFRDFKKEVLDTISWGYSLFEFYYKGQVNPYSERVNTSGQFDYHLIPRKHVSPQRGEILQREFDMSGDSYRLPEYAKNLLEFGKEDDLGRLLEICVPIIYKRNETGDWAQYCELAGNNFQQIIIEGTDKIKREQVTKALNERGSGGITAFPEGVKVDNVKGSSASSNDLFDTFESRMSDKILKLILGQAGTTSDTGSVGSYAKAKVSLKVEESIHNDDKVYFLDFMNYKFKEKMKFWGFSDKGKFVFEEMDIKTRLEMIEEDKALNDIKPLSDEYLKEKYGKDSFKDVELKE